MSLSSSVMEYITKQPEDAWASLNPQIVAEGTGEDAGKVSKAMWSLEHTGRIRLRRDGRSITGVDTVIRAEAAQGRQSDSPRTRRARGEAPALSPRAVRTPHLDAYLRAKTRAASMVDGDEAQYIEVTFRENALAEEALKLRDALTAREAAYDELSTQYKTTLYEYEGVKSRIRNGTIKRAHESGAVAQPGD